eukprot:gene23928-23989_t
MPSACWRRRGGGGLGAALGELNGFFDPASRQTAKVQEERPLRLGALRHNSPTKVETGPDSPVTDALVLSRLTKTFGGKTAVSDLDLTVRSGDVFGIDAIGDPAAAKAITAWAPDEPMLYDRLNPMEYLEFVAGLWGVE